MRSRVLTFILLGLLIGSFPANLYAGRKSGKASKIVYVDLKTVFQEYTGTKKATDVFREKISNKQIMIDEKKEEIKTLREDYEKKSVVLSDEEKEKKSEEIDKKVKDLQDFVMQSNRELEEKEQNLTKTIIKDIKKVVDKLGQEEKYDLILDKNERIVLFATDALDITQDVLDGLKALLEESATE